MEISMSNSPSTSNLEQPMNVIVKLNVVEVDLSLVLEMVGGGGGRECGEKENEQEKNSEYDVDTEPSYRDTDSVMAITGPAVPRVRKRRRWGLTPEDMQRRLALTMVGLDEDYPKEEEGKVKKVKRFGKDEDRMDNTANPMLAAAAANLTPEETTALVLRLKIEDLTKELAVVSNSFIQGVDYVGMYGEQRSPSPEPIYDYTGRRVNTRNARRKEKLNIERNKLIERALDTIPNFIPPADYRPPGLESKIVIPLAHFPDGSYMQLILGPRGVTHKELEESTNCKIYIRGRGVQETKIMDRIPGGENEPPHVYIVGNQVEHVEDATR